jgi:long-chain acyl-CoA synthetase
MLEATAERWPERTALVWRGERIPWARLAAAVHGRSAELAALGVGPARAVGLLLGNGPEFVVELFAIAARGATAVPLNPGVRADEVLACLRGGDLAALVAGPETEAVARQVADRWPARVAVQAVAPGRHLAEPAAGGAGEPRAASDADVLWGFSSGSTGTPKRIVRRQSNLVAEADNFTATVGLGPDDVIYGAVPFFHAHGLGNCVLAAARSGAALVVEPAFEPRAALAALERERVTVLPGVPFLFRMLAEASVGRRFDASSLRLCFSAGAPLPAEIFASFSQRVGQPLRQLYGCSEAGSVTINLDPDAAGTAGSVGTPVRNVTVSVLDESDRPCPPGVPGEVEIASPALGRSAGEAPEERAAWRHGRFLTGDLGRLDAAGRLEITGRKKLYISTAASKVDPVDVERCLAGHPEVAEVVVVGVRSRGGDEIVKAVIVPRRRCAPAREDGLRREQVSRCREQLADFKVPRQIEFRDEIPRSPLGKVLRKYLV